MEYAVGHHEIDEHHEELFSLTTMLDKAVLACRRDELVPIIEFLEHYSKDHFKEEEDLMQSHDYEGYNLHKTEHAMFADNVKEIRAMFDEKKSPTHIIFKLRYLIDQLVHHIKTVDIGIRDLTSGGTE